MTTAYIIYERYFDYDGRGPTVGGVQSYIRELCALLSDVGIVPVVVQRGNEGFVVKDDTNTIVGVKCKPLSKWTRGRPLYRYVHGRVKAGKDIVIWMSDSIAIKTPGVRSISIQHGIAFDLIAGDSVGRRLAIRLGAAGVVKAFQRASALRNFRSATYTVAVDYNYLNWIRTFESNFANRRVVVIPNFSSVVQRSSNRARAEISFLFARRFTEQRGVRIMIAAAEKILARYENVRFIFAGEGPLEGEIKRRFQDNPRVTVTKYLFEEVAKHLAEVDVAVIPSCGSEGTSLSLLEAMGSGCSVICTNVGGMTNIVLDGFNGLIVDPEAGALVDAMSRLLDDERLRKRIGANAADTVEYAFSLERWRERWRGVLDEVRQ